MQKMQHMCGLINECGSTRHQHHKKGSTRVFPHIAARRSSSNVTYASRPLRSTRTGCLPFSGSASRRDRRSPAWGGGSWPGGGAVLGGSPSTTTSSACTCVLAVPTAALAFSSVRHTALLSPWPPSAASLSAAAMLFSAARTSCRMPETDAKDERQLAMLGFYLDGPSSPSNTHRRQT